MRASDLRNLTTDELKQKEIDFRKELFNLRFQNATGEIQNPLRIRIVRKDIARVLTLISEKIKKQNN
ncbi:50S ribosomal protein L29 [bacterium BMS3Abin07]|nr:50S ribosomal protein L29 [bacterium BMS3Abin07]GBE33379.1 50S ribosomal protein L29 [bacterium BMS3Bbin05]HDL20439.1 50S ribosomal protein L29 [Nitrospirota bacterium]HDO21930.1 50S ribosomal protein L29 [Nitrospirota bacterium]HDZ87728.1 50S ribosomal protein L29 [Nitrospirota bacterium]